MYRCRFGIILLPQIIMFQSTELYRGVRSHDMAACVQLYAWEITAMESIEEYGRR